MYPLNPSISNIQTYLKEQLPHREVTLDILEHSQYSSDLVEKGVIGLAVSKEQNVILSTGVGELTLYFICILKLAEQTPPHLISEAEYLFRNEIIANLREHEEFKRGVISEISYSAQLYAPFARVVLTYTGF